MISDLGARDAGCEFNFSEPQWGEISKAVGEGCGNPLLFAAMVLLERANAYRKNEPHHRPASKRAADFRRRAKLAATFRAMVAESGDSEEVWLIKLSQQDRSSFLSLIDRFARSMQFAAERLEVRPGTDHPRMKFYDAIFGIWLDAGGGLTRSRDRDQVANGPLVRYVRCVTQPVMQRNAPKSETILTMISDAKKSYQIKGFGFDEHGRIAQFPAYAAEWGAWSLYGTPIKRDFSGGFSALF